MVYFSGITLAILAPDRRAALIDRVAACGVTTAFDPNIRPNLWETPEAARDWITRAAKCMQIVLPSADDEAACFGDASPQATLARYAALGVPEIVVKNAGGTVHYHDGSPGVLHDLEKRAPVDTTGAGDSFNAAYLAARLNGERAETAIRAGHRLAARVISRRGALVAKGPFP